jgi:hypothetical protein
VLNASKVVDGYTGEMNGGSGSSKSLTLRGGALFSGTHCIVGVGDPIYAVDVIVGITIKTVDIGSQKLFALV